MLYMITLTYIRPVADIEAHLDTHRQWLADHIRAGRILVAGPLESGTGGVVLASCENDSEVEAMIAEDSFHLHGLVRYDIQAFHAAVRTDIFPAQWAPQAKSIR